MNNKRKKDIEERQGSADLSKKGLFSTILHAGAGDKSIDQLIFKDVPEEKRDFSRDLQKWTALNMVSHQVLNELLRIKLSSKTRGIAE